MSYELLLIAIQSPFVWIHVQIIACAGIKVQNTYGTKPHAVDTAGSATYTYDANGNMTSRDGQNITWDVENMPVRIDSSTFVYDGDGNRVLKTENGEVILYVNQYYEKNLTTGEETTHYYLGSREIAFKNNNGLTYVHQDHLGSTVLTTDEDGEKIAGTSYEPYGEFSESPDGLDTDKLFTGQRLDDSGLYFYNARYYDATIGRFISADTIVPDPSNPQSLNRYSYCINNPLKYVDRDGHFAVLAALVVIGAGAVIGGGTDLGVQMLLNVCNGDPAMHDINWYSVGVSAVFGAMSGGTSAAVLGTMAKAEASRIAIGVTAASIGAAFNALDYTTKEITGILNKSWSWAEFGVATGIGATTGFLSAMPSTALSGVKSGAKYVSKGIFTGIKKMSPTAGSVKNTGSKVIAKGAQYTVSGMTKGTRVLQSSAVSVKNTISATGNTLRNSFVSAYESIGSALDDASDDVWSWLMG